MVHINSGGVIIGIGGKRWFLFPSAARFYHTSAFSTESWDAVIRGDLSVFKTVLYDDPPDSPLSRTFEEIPRAATFVRPAILGSEDRTEISWCLLEYTLPTAVQPSDIISMSVFPKIFGHRDVDPDTNWATYGPYTDIEKPCMLYVYAWPQRPSDAFFNSTNPSKIFMGEILLRAVAVVDPFPGPGPYQIPIGLHIDPNTIVYDTVYYPHRHELTLDPSRFGPAPLTHIALAFIIEDLASGYLWTGRGHEKVCHIQTFDSPLFIDAVEQERGYNTMCMTREAEELLLSWEFRTDGDSKLKPTSLEVALCTTACTAGTAGTECTDPGYARATLGASAPTSLGSGVPLRGVYKNPAPLTFGTAAADWAPIVSIAIFDDTGRYLFFANFPTGDALEITDAITPTIDTEGLWITSNFNFLRALLTVDPLLTVWPDFADSPRTFYCGFYLSDGTLVHSTGTLLDFVPTAVLEDIRNFNELTFISRATGTVTDFKVFRDPDETEQVVAAVTPTHMGVISVTTGMSYTVSALDVRILAELAG